VKRVAGDATNKHESYKFIAIFEFIIVAVFGQAEAGPKARVPGTLHRTKDVGSLAKNV
jgi:hypothetical protein